MRAVTSICTLLIGTILWAQPIEMLQLRKDGFAQWRYVTGDEFDTDQVDTEKWRKSYPWGRNLGNEMLQFYADDNVFLQDGKLIMEARKEDTVATSISWKGPNEVIDDKGTVNRRPFEYTSGMLFSKDQYFQGYFEASLKTSRGKGFFPAFWLYGANPNEEIDIIEAKGERPFSYHVDMHCPSGCSDYRKFLWWRTSSYGDWIKTDSDLTADFHLYAGEWVPGEIVFYLDDVAREQWAGVLQYPANVIFNLGVSGREGSGSFDGGIDESTPFPQTFEVDYVRIYERIDEGWKEKEEAALNKKGRKKKRGKQKNSKRVMATARLFLEEDVLRIETQGPKSELLSFILMDDKGNRLQEPITSENGIFSCDLSSLDLTEIWVISVGAGSTARSLVTRP
ncbi:MAG: glycoside hydrolase family 16 protein [Flavobacteriales bacterium]|nr:glycoside hydrolase family 16 protein [Flavobacteriales bacterium]